MAGGYRVNGKNIDGDGGGEAKTATFVMEMEGDMTITINKSSAEMRPSAMCLAKIDRLKSLDICDDTFSHKRAVEVVGEQGHRQVCDVLLDQEVLPGVGNIIKNEALFDSGIDPNSKVSELTTEHVSHLVKMTRDFSMIFYKCRRDNKPLNPYLKIYRKGKCGQCEGKITNTRMGDDSERLTSFCVTCQVNDLDKIRSRNLPTKNSLLGWVNSGPAQAAQDSDWTCEICTLINKSTSSKCSACLSPKSQADLKSQVPSSRVLSNSQVQSNHVQPDLQFQSVSSETNFAKRTLRTSTQNEGKADVTGDDADLPRLPSLSEVSFDSAKSTYPPFKRQRLSSELKLSTKDKPTPLKLHPTRNAVKAAFNSNPLTQLSTVPNSRNINLGFGTQVKQSQTKGNVSLGINSSQLTPLKLHPTRNAVSFNQTRSNSLLTQNSTGPYSQTMKGQSQGVSQTQTHSNLKFDSVPKTVLPSCEQHKKQCLMREVRKDGPNKKRFFFACPARQCNFFKWADENFPLCEGHGKRCVLRVTLKQGPNNGRKFFACSMEKSKKPCQFFSWADQYSEINVR